jgi:YhgE/Pip-like protein
VFIINFCIDSSPSIIKISKGDYKMNLLKNKLVLLSPIIVLTIVLIFGLAFKPTLNPTPKNVPIALVNEDQGMDVPGEGKMNFGKAVSEKLHEMVAENGSAVKWKMADNYEEAIKGLDNKEYYAALIIPKDFSAKQFTLRTPNPTSSEVQILVNQGMNMMAATMTGQLLNNVIDNLNANVRTQLLADFEKQGLTITPKQASALALPIVKKITNVNETGTHSANGNAPISLFQPLWLGSIAGAVVLVLMMGKLVFVNRAEKLKNLIIQIFIGAVMAVFSGFGLTWIADTLGMNIPQVTDTGLFLAVVYFSFFLIITAVLSWLGIKGVGIFVIILFFGAPLLAMPPEFMSSFYRDWVYSWLPMRFMIDGLRDLLFFGKGLSWNHAISVLVWIGISSMVIILSSAFKLQAKSANKVNQMNL